MHNLIQESGRILRGKVQHPQDLNEAPIDDKVEKLSFLKPFVDQETSNSVTPEKFLRNAARKRMKFPIIAAAYKYDDRAGVPFYALIDSDQKLHQLNPHGQGGSFTLAGRGNKEAIRELSKQATSSRKLVRLFNESEWVAGEKWKPIDVSLNEAVDEDDMVELSMDVTDYFMTDLTSQIPKLFENAIEQAIDNSDLNIDRDDYENLKKESIDSISDVVRDAGSSLISDEL